MSLNPQRVERFIEETRRFGLENSAGRFYSIYRGTVTSTLDNDRMGRVKLRVPVVSKQPELPAYAMPVMPFGGRGYGIFFQPAVGEQVYVLFEHGDVNKPLYIGGWFAAPAGVSDLPDEIGDPTNPQSTKIIKTPIGHGLLFEDSSAFGKRVSLFSGEQTGPGQTLALHKITLDDTNERILVQSKGQHFINLSDNSAAQFVRLGSATGFLFTLHDTLGQASLVTPSGHLLRLDDTGQHIVVQSKNGNSFRIDDILNSFTFSTAAGRTATIDDTTQTISMVDPLGNTLIISPVGVQVASAALVSIVAAAAAQIVAGGPVTIQGVGTTMNTVGGAPAVSLNTGASSSIMIGAVTSTILGSALMFLLGGASVTVAGVLLITGLQILLGGPAARALVDERILTWLATHTHTAVGLGLPTSPPVQAAALSVPNAYTTVKVKAE